mmetsp:Transcript_63136/g.137240  ORF Transcript_63136/g.137240 Transcript_63136/m.137240 type:complete len:226 (-) Transcript_63136:127-804(-)
MGCVRRQTLARRRRRRPPGPQPRLAQPRVARSLRRREASSRCPTWHVLLRWRSRDQGGNRKRQPRSLSVDGVRIAAAVACWRWCRRSGQAEKGLTGAGLRIWRQKPPPCRPRRSFQCSSQARRRPSLRAAPSATTRRSLSLRRHGTGIVLHRWWCGSRPGLVLLRERGPLASATPANLRRRHYAWWTRRAEALTTEAGVAHSNRISPWGCRGESRRRLPLPRSMA